MKLLAVLASLALAAVGAPAFAQAGLIKDFSLAEMRTALKGVGAEVTKEGASDAGVRYLEAKHKDGLSFAVYGYECDSKEASQRCRGAYLTASFTLEDEDDLPDALEEIDYAAVADFADDGRIKLARYLIFDEGVTPGNLRVNLEVFLNISNDVWEYLTKEGYLE